MLLYHLKKVIKFIDQLTDEAKETQSVNTLYKINGKIFGHNTDISGFELSLRHINIMLMKESFNIRSGGVVSFINFSS